MGFVRDAGPLTPSHEVGWYNGWNPVERRARTPIQQAAVRDGTMARPVVCSVCAARHRDDPANPIWLHDEDYDQPLAAHHICRRCHLTLHRRFEQPEPWHALVARHGTGNCWFEQLSMDPASRWRPFRETYPRGLPSRRA